MNVMRAKLRYRLVNICILALSLVCPAMALAVNIQVGGDQRLDLSRHQVVHQVTFDAGKSPDAIFWGVLDVGEKAGDPWAGMLARGAYVLTHAGKAGAVRYYFRERLEPRAGRPLSAHPLSVEVGGSMNDKISAAGLIYGYDPKTKHYLAFVKGAGRSYAIYQRNQEGMRRIMGGTSAAVKQRQSNKLAIVPDGARIGFYINGTRVAGIEDAAATRGAAGILAISSGMFLFDNFTVYADFRSNAPSPVTTKKERPVKAAASRESPLSAPPAKPNPRLQPPAEAEKAQTRTSTTQRKKLQSYKEVLQTGMARQRVIEIFGAASWERGTRLFYDLGAKGPGEDPSTLVIQFDEDDNVLAFMESRD